MSRIPFVILAFAIFLTPAPVESQQLAVVTETPRVGGPELRIRSVPDDADVTINNRYLGRTPITVTDLSPGTHRVSLSLRGYKTVERWVRLRDNAIVEIDVSLEQRIGYLSATILPEKADVYLNGNRLSDPPSRLQVGEYTVTAEAFGYRTEFRRVTIKENETTRVTIVLEPALFSVSSPALSNRAFNPRNPGPAGQLSIRFTATGPGRARVSVLGPGGDTVFSKTIEELTAPAQRVLWTGRTADGAPVPDGVYTILVEGRSLDGEITSTTHAGVSVDSTVHLAYRAIFGGTAGAILAPDATVLPAGGFQVSTGALNQWAVTANSQSRLVPVHLGLRVGLGSAFETALTGEVVVSDATESLHLQSTASVRWAWTKTTGTESLRPIGAIEAALSIASSAGNPTLPRDPTTNHPGFRITTPTGFAYRNFSLVAAPSLVISDSHPVSPSKPKGGRFPLYWAYNRAALFYDTGDTVVALSAAVRSAPCEQGLRFVGPFSTALELHRLMPNTPLFISAVLTADFQSAFLMRAGLGLGLIR